MKHYYQILELPLNASPRRIKEQYRKLAKRYHPDRLDNPTDRTRFAEKFKQINEAYAALSAIVRRADLSPRERKLDFLYHQGRELCEQRKWSKALIVFNEIVALEPAYRDTLAWLREARRKHKNIAALYLEANGFYQQQKWPEAMAVFKRLLREDPNYKDAMKKYKKARREQLMEDFMSQY
jgi:curved DNA-binding protein CbpA